MDTPRPRVAVRTPAAGNDSARSSQSVTIGGGAPQVTTSCADYASRLTSATGANPLTSVTYNDHGDAFEREKSTIQCFWRDPSWLIRAE
jgi:hypothetical protein